MNRADFISECQSLRNWWGLTDDEIIQESRGSLSAKMLARISEGDNVSLLQLLRYITANNGYIRIQNRKEYLCFLKRGDLLTVCSWIRRNFQYYSDEDNPAVSQADEDIRIIVESLNGSHGFISIDSFLKMCERYGFKVAIVRKNWVNQCAPILHRVLNCSFWGAIMALLICAFAALSGKAPSGGLLWSGIGLSLLSSLPLLFRGKYPFRNDFTDGWFSVNVVLTVIFVAVLLVKVLMSGDEPYDVTAPVDWLWPFKGIAMYGLGVLVGFVVILAIIGSAIMIFLSLCVDDTTFYNDSIFGKWTLNKGYNRKRSIREAIRQKRRTEALRRTRSELYRYRRQRLLTIPGIVSCILGIGSPFLLIFLFVVMPFQYFDYWFWPTIVLGLISIVCFVTISVSGPKERDLLRKIEKLKRND